jgi:hypothetical protein
VNTSETHADHGREWFPLVEPLASETRMDDGQEAVLAMYSRECSAELLGRLVGSNCFVERPLAPEVIEAAERESELLYITAPELPDIEIVVDYYVRLTAKSEDAIARIKKNIVVLALDNSEPLWLSQKLVGEAAKQERLFIAEWVSERHKSGKKVVLHTFEPSEMTEQIAHELRLQPDQASSRTIEIGSKYSAKRIFRACGIRTPTSTKECHSLQDLASEIATLLGQEADSWKVLLKLSSTLYGAGQGNALVDMRALIDKYCGELDGARVLGYLNEGNVDVVDKKLGWKGFVQEMSRAGVIAERYVEAKHKSSPSAQGRVTKDGSVVLTSIHEQRFAANEQTYIGSFYPVRQDYRKRIEHLFERIAHKAFDEGHVGPISVDFLCVRAASTAEWEVLPIEINNRLTGTAHSFRIVTSLLTQDGRTGFCVSGEPRVYLASDAIYKPEYVGLRPAEVIGAIAASEIHYNDDNKKGVILYMLSGLAFGKCGAVAIGSSERDCTIMQEGIYKILDDLAAAKAKGMGRKGLR